MRTWAHWTARTVMLTASFAAAGTGFSGAAFAASGGNGGGAGGIGSGNQASAPVSAPVGVCGNAAAVLGDSAAGCEGTGLVRPATRSGSGRTFAADSAPGMADISFYSLAIGALMAGAVALKMAGRRSRDRYNPGGRRV